MTFKKVPVNIVDDYSTSTGDYIYNAKNMNITEEENKVFDKSTDRIVYFII